MCDFCHAVTVDTFASLRFPLHHVSGTVNCLWSRHLMHLDILFFIVHRAFLSGAFGSSTGEYSYSSCSSLPSDNFVRLLTGPMFIFEHFSSKTSPTRHFHPIKALGNSSPQATNSNLQTGMRTQPIGGCAWIYYAFLNALDIGKLVSLLCYVLWMAHYASSFVH